MKNNGGLESSIFATTALVAFAGAAAADVAITGSAEMGIVAGNNQTTTRFFQSVDVRFSMSGTTDNGLSFGAVVDLDDVGERGTAGTGDIAGAFADFNVFVAGDFGRLTMGDTDGALDWAITETADRTGNAGSINDAETGHLGYLGNGFADATNTVFGGTTAGGYGYNAQVLRYEYTIGTFGLALSAQVDGNDLNSGDPNLQIGFRYGLEFAGGNVNLGLGYASINDVTGLLAGDQSVATTAVSAALVLDSGFGATVTYASFDERDAFGGDGDHIGVGFDYIMGPLALHANFGEYDYDTTSVFADSEGYGLAAAYDLGGGLTVQAGYGEGRRTAANASGAAINRDFSTFSLGLAMSF